MDATAGDVVVLVLVVGLRLVVPLLIPRFPLPAIVACLVVDGVDQTIFQTCLSHAFWDQIAGGYQGYDKALDVYYLTIAYTATMRNWTNYSAMRWAQGLWLYRLAGTTLFEVLHRSGNEDSWRWLLMVFPNTFEYFFIAIEIVRLRWDPRRLAPRRVAAVAIAIWVVIKLPQEWWIHVAKLDFTDVAGEHPWVLPSLLVIAAVALAAGWSMRSRLPAADWTWRVAAPPLPTDLRTPAERAGYRARYWRVFDLNLLEKAVLLALVCEVFAQILPGSQATDAQVASAVAVLAVVNTAIGLAFDRRHHSIEHTAAQFATLCALNVVTLEVLSLLSDRFDLDHALFFALLVALIVLLYDRYRPVRNERFGIGEHRPVALVSPTTGVGRSGITSSPGHGRR